MYHLKDLGFDPLIIAELKKEGIPGRVSGESHGEFRILTEEGEMDCRLSGHDLREFSGTSDWPVTGDFVLTDTQGIIRKILPRRTFLTRGDEFSASLNEGLVSNCDWIFVVMSLNQDFNERKLRWFLIAAGSSGAVPVVILTKADLNSQEINEEYLRLVRTITSVPVIVTRRDDPSSTEPVLDLLKGGRTAALLGASGVGKSTLVNLILGKESLRTSSIRSSDDQGRHTTTHREIIVIPGLGCLIDTPGMRRIRLIDDGDSVDDVFSDLTAIMKQCRYSNCSHQGEPGCAVQTALEEGRIRRSDLRDYRSMLEEARLFEVKAKKREKDRVKRNRKKEKPRRKSWSDQDL